MQNAKCNYGRVISNDITICQAKKISFDIFLDKNPCIRYKHTMKKLDLTRLYERFVSLIADKGLTQYELADRVDMNQPNINALLNKKRPLSAYYLFKFIRRRIISVDDIYDGNAESDREKEFWAIARAEISLDKRIVMGVKGANHD